MMPMMCLLLLVMLRQPLQCKASINGGHGILCICTNEVQTIGPNYIVYIIIINKDAPSAKLYCIHYVKEFINAVQQKFGSKQCSWIKAIIKTSTKSKICDACFVML